MEEMRTTNVTETNKKKYGNIKIDKIWDEVNLTKIYFVTTTNLIYCNFFSSVAYLFLPL